MIRNKKTRKKAQRRFVFTGNSVSEDIVIGNHGNALLRATGHFNLSGILYSLNGTVKFIVNGSGQITFAGKCRHLILEADGDCIIDLKELRCDVITCASVKGLVTVLLGESRRVDITEMSGESTLKIKGNPLVTAHSMDENARIVCPRSFVAPLVVHAPPLSIG